MYSFTPPFEQPAASPIRALFKYLNDPEMISFAGGYPDSALFDVAQLEAAAQRAQQAPVRCLQYGPTEGLPELKEQLIALMERRGVSCSADQMLITTGSQQGLDLLLRVMVSPGDVVLCEQPAYPATLQALRLQQANIVTVPVDEHGLNTEKLEAMFNGGEAGQPKLLYTVPTFANPTGATLSVERRMTLLKLAVRHRFLIVEDDPYSGLRFTGRAVPSLLSLASHVEGARDWVVHFSSLSKIVAPGLRTGWLIAHPEITRRCVIAKQTTDLCSTPWTQKIAAEYLAAGALESHLDSILACYQRKSEILCNELRGWFGDQIRFHQPEGGMFVWASITGTDTSELLQAAIDKKVLFVPGKAFYADKVDQSTLRLSYAAPGADDIRSGVLRLRQAWDVLRKQYPAS